MFSKDRRFMLSVRNFEQEQDNRDERFRIRRDANFGVEVAHPLTKDSPAGGVVFIGNVTRFGDPSQGIYLPGGQFTTLRDWTIRDIVIPFQAGKYPAGFDVPTPTPITAFFFYEEGGATTQPEIAGYGEFLSRIPRTLQLTLIRKKETTSHILVRAAYPAAVLRVWVDIQTG
jgi:hypothetical protein